MVPTSRRRLLAATASTAALAGCLSRGDDDEPEEDDTDLAELQDASLPEDLATVLDAIPDQVGQQRVQTVLVGSPEPEADEEDATAVRTVTPMADELGLDRSAVDRVAVAEFEDYERRLVVATGSFGADDADVAAEREAQAAITVEDGFAAVASADGEPWDGALEAIDVARGDPDLGLLAQAPLTAVLDPVAEESPLFVFPDFPPEELPDVDADLDTVETVAVTQETIDETTRETTLVFLFSSADDVDDDVVAELVESGASELDEDDATIEEEGPRVVVTVEEPVPDHELPDDSPALHARFVSSDDGGILLQFEGEEPADPANVEFRVDGEAAADPPWAGDDELAPGESYPVALDPFVPYEVVWLDPEREDVEHTLGRHVGGAHEAFERDYDPDAQRLTVTYVGDRAADPGKLQLHHGQEDPHSSENEGTPLDERVDELTSGTSFVVEDVAFGDRVSLRIASDDDGYSRSVFHFRARPPGAFEFVREDGRSLLVYRGEERVDAERYRIEVEEEPTDTQWTDEHDELSPGDRVALDVDLGRRGQVVWVQGDDSLYVDGFEVVPEATFDFEYDEDAGEIAITHAGGESLDADAIDVEVHPPADAPVDAEWDAETISEGVGTVVSVPDEVEEQEFGPIVGVTYDGVALDYQDFEHEEAVDSDSS